MHIPAPIPYITLLHWLLSAGLMVFGIFVLWDCGILPNIIEQDKTRISIIILLLFCAAFLHSASRAWVIALEYLVFTRCLQHQQPYLLTAISTRKSPVQDYLLLTSHNPAAQENTLLAEIMAENMRGPHQTGWFITGLMIKLGLLGTVVGFVLMLSSISGLETLDITDIKLLMQKMTQGMGIAMNTTMVGLVSSMLLGIQYLLLDKSADRLVAETLHLEQHWQNCRHGTV